MGIGLKIHGLYAGVIKNPGFLETCSEADLFFNIKLYTRKLAKAVNPILYEIYELEYAIEYCIYKTTRFGVEISVPEVGKHIEKTPSYLTWFDWWNEYVSSMSYEELNNYNTLKEEGNDVTYFKPAGNWFKKLKM